MDGKLIQLERTTLDTSHTLSKDNSHINGGIEDEVNEHFKSLMINVYSSPSRLVKISGVPSEFLKKNTYRVNNDEIKLIGNTIQVGDNPNHGVIIPRDYGSIVFAQLYNCAPLVSLIKGNQDYISFLHTWSIPGDSKVVDKQVKKWMETIAKKGDVAETIFAPRRNSSDSDTAYNHALEYMTKHSETTIVLTRNINQIKGIANTEGVFFKNCGYHLWNS